jgi:hypothetical protein
MAVIMAPSDQLHDIELIWQEAISAWAKSVVLGHMASLVCATGICNLEYSCYFMIGYDNVTT